MGWMDDAIERAEKPQPVNDNNSWMDQVLAAHEVETNPVKVPSFDMDAEFDRINTKLDGLESQSQKENLTYQDYQERRAVLADPRYADAPTDIEGQMRIWNMYKEGRQGLEAMMSGPELDKTRAGYSAEKAQQTGSGWDPLSPEDNYKSIVSNIHRTVSDPAQREKELRLARTKFKQELYGQVVDPVTDYFAQQLANEHVAEKQGSRVADFMDHYYRGVANVSSAVTQAYGEVTGNERAKDIARAYWLAQNAPEIAPSLDEDWIDKALGMAAETGPYIVLTTAAAAATGGVGGAVGANAAFFGAMGGGMVSFGIEGNSAYQTALDHDVPEPQARLVGFQTGLVAAAVEAAGGSGSKFFRKSVQKGFTNKMKMAGKWTIERAKTALAEALEEAGQELAAIGGESTYRDINGKEIVDRTLGAAKGGFLLGGAMDASLGTVSRMQADQAAAEFEKRQTKQRRALNKIVSEDEAKGIIPETSTKVTVRENREEDVTPATVGRSYDQLLEDARAGDQEAADLLKRAEFKRDDQGGLQVIETDEGTLAAAGILRDLGVNEYERIGMSEQARSMADQLEEGYETYDSAVQALVDGGLDASLPLSKVRVIGKNFRDATNRVIVELYQNHDAGTLLHEHSEAYYRGIWGDQYAERVSKLRQEYENNTGEVEDTGDQEWLADKAVDYAVHNRIHERAGMSVRRMFNKYRQVFKRILARAINLRRHIAEGNVPLELEEILAAPFKGRGTQVDIEATKPVDLAGDAPLSVEEAKAASRVLGKGIGEIAAMSAADVRAAVKGGSQTYKLSGPEQKILDKYGEGALTDEKLFIAADGTPIKVGGFHQLGGKKTYDHEATAAGANMSLLRVLDSGAMRTFKSGSQFAIEIGENPITNEQAATLQQWLTRNFEPGGMVVAEMTGADSAPPQFMEQRSDIPVIIKKIRKSLSTSALQSTGYKLERGPGAAPSYGQLAEGHVLPERLKMSEGARRAFMKEHTGKESMKDMTYAEAEQYIEALQILAKQKKLKLNNMNTTADSLATLVEDYNKIDESTDNGLKAVGLRAMWRGMQKNASWYLQNQTRVERMIHALNGHEEGMLYNQVWMDVKESNEMATVNAQDIAIGLQTKIASYGPAKAKAVYSHKPIEIFQRPSNDHSLRHRGMLRASERMSIYMLMQNENGKRHLMKGNGYTETEAATVIQWMKKNSPEEIEIAKYMMDIYEQQFAGFAAAHLAATGQTLTKEDAYSPLYMATVDFTDHKDYLQNLIDMDTYSRASMKIGETEDRVRGASQAIKLNAFDNFLYNTERIARYTAMAPTIVRVGKILSNRNFKTKVNGATHGYGAEILQAWLKDTARGYAADAKKPIDRIIRTWRKNSMVYVLGYKIPSALRQTLSILPAMAKDPMMIPLVIRNISLTPPGTPAFRKMAAEIYNKSNMMRTRNWDRVEGLINRAKSAEKRLAGKTTLDEKALFAVKFLDKHTTIYAWQAAYQLASRTMGEKEAIRYADNLVERTQPMGSAINLPAFFRGGTIAQLFTTFENQINQNYNFWAHDIAGEYKAGKIGKGMVAYRVLMSYVLPAMLMGAIGRGELPDGPGEIVEDLVTYPIAGFVLFGRWINALMKGFGTSGTIIDAPFNEAKRMVAEFKKEDPDTGVIAWRAARTAGAATGKVPQQLFNVAEAVGAKGGPKDLRDLIYGPRFSKQQERERKQR